MTDIEKIARHDTLVILRQRIGSGFGTADGIFAGHPSDLERAKEFRKLAFAAGITLDEIKELALGYLHNKGYASSHIKVQIEKLTKFFATKIS